MPKATRAKETQETPKKRSRKTQPADGNGTAAVEPVTTAPAIADPTPEMIAQQQPEAAKKANGGAKPANVASVQPEKPAATDAVASKAEAMSEVSVPKEPVASARQNGHVSEEMVRRRAYELYLQRRGQGGSPEQDWFQALQEISGRHVA